MPRKPKGVGAPNFVEISQREVPAWMTAVPTPEGEQLLDLLNEALQQPGLVSEGPFAGFFEKLVARGEQVATAAEQPKKEDVEGRKTDDDKSPRGHDARIVVALQLLHLVPGYLDVLDAPPCRWLGDALKFVFTYRRYDLIVKVQKRRGRPQSDDFTAALLDREAIFPRNTSGLPTERPVTSEATLRNAQSHARRAHAEREKRLSDTWARAGAEDVAHDWAASDQGCSRGAGHDESGPRSPENPGRGRSRESDVNSTDENAPSEPEEVSPKP